MKSVTKSELHRQTAKVLAAVDPERSVVVTEEHKLLMQRRAAELQADSSIGLTWDELDARLGRRWK